MPEPISIVLLPGLDGTGIMFEPFVRHFPPEWQTITVRYPGDQCLGYDELMPLVRAALPADGPFVILGESFGGPLAIRIAAEKPAGLCGVVLCATFATTSAPWLPQFCRRLVRPSTVFAWQVGGRFAARLRGMCPKDIRRLFNRIRHQVKIDVIATRVRETVEVNVLQELQQIAVPMLYLVAKRDHVVPARCLHTILQHKPDVQVSEFDTAHWILQTCGGEVVAAMQAFIDRALTHEAQDAMLAQ